MSAMMSLASRIGKRASSSCLSMASRASVVSSWSFHKVTGFPRNAFTSTVEVRSVDGLSDEMQLDSVKNYSHFAGPAEQSQSMVGIAL